MKLRLCALLVLLCLLTGSLAGAGSLAAPPVCRGEGTVIAVIDTAFDTGHALFVLSPKGRAAARLTQEGLPENFRPFYVNAKIPYAYDYGDGDGDVFPHGWQENLDAAPFHGTHVAAIAAANSLGEASEGKFDGAAPEAQLLLMKVMRDGDPTGQQDDAALMAAVEDAIALGADVINISIGDPGAPYTGDREKDFSAVTTKAAQAGIVVVASAGNDGRVGRGDALGLGLPRYDQPDTGISMVPAQSDFVTAVASAQAAGGMSGFSNWGGAGLHLTPAITAPGGDIYSAMPRPSPQGPTTAENYGTLSGTSMAAPYLAGCAARVCQAVRADPARFGTPTGLARVDLVNTLLASTAVPQKEGTCYVFPRRQGAGLVDAGAALHTDVVLYTPEKTPTGRYFTGPQAAHRTAKADLGEWTPAAGEAYPVSFAVTAQNYGFTSHTYRLSLAAFSERPDAVEVGTPEAPQTLYVSSGESLCAGDIPVRFSGPQVTDGVVTVPARGTAQITVELELPLDGPGECYALNRLLQQSGGSGVYVEGFLFLTAQDGAPDLSLPWMGFYGDWTRAPVFDVPLYYDPAQPGAESAVPHYWDEYGAGAILLKRADGTVGVAGCNTLAGGFDGLLDARYTAVSPKAGQAVPSLVLLRDASSLACRVLDSEGRAVPGAFAGGLARHTAAPVPKSAYTASPVTTYRQETKPLSSRLAGGWYTLECTALAQAGGAAQTLAMEFYVDDTAPVFTAAPTLRRENGVLVLHYAARDDHYLQGAVLSAGERTLALPYEYAAQDAPGTAVTVDAVVDAAWLTEKSAVTVTLLDYAGNTTAAAPAA